MSNQRISLELARSLTAAIELDEVAGFRVTIAVLDAQGRQHEVGDAVAVSVMLTRKPDRAG